MTQQVGHQPLRTDNGPSVQTPATSAAPQVGQVQVKPAPTTQAAGTAGGAQLKPNTAPLFKVKPFKKTIEQKKLKFLVYAKYGAGKSTLVASACDVIPMRDVFLISAEGGELSLAQNDRVRNTDYIDVMQVRTFNELQTVKDFLSAHIIIREQGDEAKLRALQERVLGEDPDDVGRENTRLRRYQTVIIDSLSELNDYCMQALLGIHQNFSFSGDMPVAEFKEYKQNFNKMQMLVRMFRDLDMHVLVTAAASWEQDELKAFHFTPNLTGKLGNVVQGFFDVVGFLQTGAASDEKHAPRRLYVQPVGGRFDAKTRLAGFKGSYFEDPTMRDLAKAAGMQGI